MCSLNLDPLSKSMLKRNRLATNNRLRQVSDLRVSIASSDIRDRFIGADRSATRARPIHRDGQQDEPILCGGAHGSNKNG